MGDSHTVFWENNARACALFYDLVARMERNAYDDDYLTTLNLYQEESPDTPNFYIFAARYLLSHSAYADAVKLGERAYRLRPVNYEVWKVLIDAYMHTGRDIDAVVMQGYAYALYPNEAQSVPLPKENLHEMLGRLSIALDRNAYAPHIKTRMHLEDDGQLTSEHDTFLGEELPLTMPAGSARFWSGLYVEEGFLSPVSMFMDEQRHNAKFMLSNLDLVFDLQKAQTACGDVHIELPPGKEAVVPVAGTAFYQNFTLKTTNREYPGYIGKMAFSHFRLNENTTLSSNEPYAVGTPILLGHNPERKKLVLNILVDGLCWPVVRPLFAEHMPRIAKFFSRGVIFDRHFSSSEFTYPSLATIETGLYAHHTHIFNENNTHELSPDIYTVAERMHDLGYYCSCPMETGTDIYQGVLRGYDRILASYGTLRSHEAAEYTIRQLEAFSETDQFIYFRTTDVHPLNINTPLKFSTSVEARIPLVDRFVKLDPTLPSIRIPHLPIYLQQNIISMHHVDRCIGAVLSYIEDHYEEDDYVVNLYSDHGFGIFENDPPNGTPDFIGEYGTGAAWMIRGAGVPHGIVADELTSTVDLYPTLGHLCGFPVNPDIDGNLPALFGGKERDVAYSASMFPGQTFKLAVRAKKHALRLETRMFLDEDGTVDFEGATVGIYPRGWELRTEHMIDNEKLRAFFYPRARDFVRSIANNGEFWPSMRTARPEWFRDPCPQ